MAGGGGAGGMGGTPPGMRGVNGPGGGGYEPIQQPMGGGQQGGFGGNQMGGGFNQQPMQQPMGGGFNQQPMQQPMGGFGGGYGQQQMQQPMGGFGQMGGGYGQMGGFGQQMPQRQMGGYGQQMGFNQQRQMQQPMGGFGGGFGGGYNPMGDMGQMNRGFNQQQMGGFGGQMGGGFGGQMGGGFNQQGGQGLQGQMNSMSSLLRGMPMGQQGGMQGGMGNNMQPNQNPAAQTNSTPMSFEDFSKNQGSSNELRTPEQEAKRQQQQQEQLPAAYQNYLNDQNARQNAMPMDRNMMSQIARAQQGGMQGGMGMSGLGQSPGMSGTASPQMNAQFQAFMNQSAGRPDNYGRESSQGMGGSPVTTSDAQAIPEYARPYAQNMMGGAFGALSQPGQGRQGIQGLMGGNLSQNSGMPTQSQMRGTQAPGRSMTPDEFSAMMQSAYGRSA